MILNARNNNFVFRFPQGFIFPELETKYVKYLRRMNTPFDRVHDYLNHTVQSVTFPSISTGMVIQTLDKIPQNWRQTVDMSKAMAKEMTVNFQATDGYLNYWLMFEQFQEYIRLENNVTEYFPDFSLQFLDRVGYQLLNVKIMQPIMISLDAVEMSYSSIIPDFKSFSATFAFNHFELEVVLD